MREGVHDLIRRSSGRRFDVLALSSFVALGVPDGVLGTAWPSMRRSFGAPVGDLGLVLVAATAGSVLVAALVGRLVRRMGVDQLLAGSAACAAVAAGGFAVAPGLGVVLGVAVLSGVASGSMDGGLNTAVGLAGRPRLLNLLHGAYGIGTSVGPLAVVAALLAGSWRVAYGLLLALDAVIALLWVRHRRTRTGPEPAPIPEADPPTAPAGPPPGGDRRAWPARRGRPPPQRGAVATGIAVFFVYTGLEVGAGQWETTFVIGHLQLSESAAGLATFGYWGALTAVRLALGLLPRTPRPATVVSSGTAAAVAATALVWWGPGPAVTIGGFLLLGAALGGVFPALVALTPERVGPARARDVIAWQVGAAAAGGAAVSALIGLILSAAGLAALGPSVFVLAVVLVVTRSLS